MAVLQASANRRLASSEWLALGGLAALGTAFVLSPDHIEDGPVICPFRRLTGLPCPGCGLTRSWVYLAHGWWRESFLSHPFGALAVAVVLALAVAVVVARARGVAPPDIDRIAKHPVAIGLFATWMGFAVVRLVVAL